MSGKIVNFMAAADSLKRQRNLRAQNPVAQEVSFELPEDFDVIVRLAEGEDLPPPFYQCLAPKMTLISFMQQTFSFTLEVPQSNGSVESAVHTILYRDLIAAASCSGLSHAHEPWIAYARDIFYTAYGLLLGSPNTEKPYGHLELPNGRVSTREWLPGHLILAVRFFDFPMQCANFWARDAIQNPMDTQEKRRAAHPLAVIVGESYQSALVDFEENARYLDMSHVYLHDAGHASTEPDANVWFPQW